MPSGTVRNRNLLGLDREELEQFAVEQGLARYRGRQIYRGIYARRQEDFQALTDLDKQLRVDLASRFTLRLPSLESEWVSSDGSVRHLLALEDGQHVEAVFMPEARRATLCISSQVGCALDCRFCFTALLGAKRNLTAGEIVGQVLALQRAHAIPRAAALNVVFMGMGEPLLNFEAVMKAVRLLADREGIGIAPRRITLSTVGIAPRIVEMGRLAVRPHLAVSLNASSDEQRAALMPINRKYPLRELLAACRAYPLRPREWVTFEYVLLDGVNDSDADAERVAGLVRGLRTKINLIPYNSGPALPYRSPPLERVLAFQETLSGKGVPAFIRISRGQDVMGACGQLSLASAPGLAAPSASPA